MSFHGVVAQVVKQLDAAAATTTTDEQSPSLPSEAFAIAVAATAAAAAALKYRGRAAGVYCRGRCRLLYFKDKTRQDTRNKNKDDFMFEMQLIKLQLTSSLLSTACNTAMKLNQVKLKARLKKTDKLQSTLNTRPPANKHKRLSTQSIANYAAGKHHNIKN